MTIRSFLILIAGVVMLAGCSATSYVGITKSGQGQYHIATVEGSGYAVTNGVLACKSKQNGDLNCKKVK